MLQANNFLSICFKYDVLNSNDRGDKHKLIQMRHNELDIKIGFSWLIVDSNYTRNMTSKMHALSLR